jgi:hypothetical protein
VANTSKYQETMGKFVRSGDTYAVFGRTINLVMDVLQKTVQNIGVADDTAIDGKLSCKATRQHVVLVLLLLKMTFRVSKYNLNRLTR